MWAFRRIFGNDDDVYWALVGTLSGRHPAESFFYSWNFNFASFSLLPCWCCSVLYWSATLRYLIIEQNLSTEQGGLFFLVLSVFRRIFGTDDNVYWALVRIRSGRHPAESFFYSWNFNFASFSTVPCWCCSVLYWSENLRSLIIEQNLSSKHGHGRRKVHDYFFILLYLRRNTFSKLS